MVTFTSIVNQSVSNVFFQAMADSTLWGIFREYCLKADIGPPREALLSFRAHTHKLEFMCHCVQ